MPMRLQTMSTTLARIVRLSYPEWTVWSLPLTAYEFWFVVDANRSMDTELQHAIAAQSGVVAPVDEWSKLSLADAFATYTMGPAYGCAAIALILDPAMQPGPDPGALAHEVRAHTIIETLEAMDSAGSAIDRLYGDIARELREGWQAAVQQACEPRSAEAEAELAGQKARAAVLARAMVSVLDGRGYIKLTAVAWNQVLQLRDQLRSGTATDAVLPVGMELWQILNAGWLARIAPLPGRRPDLTKPIQDLLQKVVERSKPGSGRGLARRIQ
jgi:hypothetical protein